MMKKSLVTCLLMLCVSSSLLAADWPAFRGPKGDGHSSASDVPTKWAIDQGVAWQVDLPGNSNGSPVVLGDRIFLTTADAGGHERILHCFFHVATRPRGYSSCRMRVTFTCFAR